MEFINKTGVDRIKLNPYVVPIAIGENTLLINLLHGTAELISTDEAEYVQRCTPGSWPELDEVLLARGYWIFGETVTALLQLLWEKDLCIPQMPHYSLLVTYVCNFDCSYCYQSSRVVTAEEATMSHAQCEAVMDFVADNGPGLVSLYGGEPLLPVNESQVTWITSRALELGCDVAVTTNGWWLEEFLPAFPQERTKWIEVTCHDVQGGTLAPKVVRGLRAAISLGHRVQVRTVFGFSTMQRIPAFLDGLKEAELLGRVKVSFGSLLGPPDGGLHREDVLFAGGNEVLTESGFKPYFPGGDVLECLFETGVLKPRFRRCGAGRGILVFDPAGDIYPCWYAVGVKELSLGQYLPKVSLKAEAVQAWSSSIFSFSRCLDCRYALLCGSGCRYEEYLEHGTVGHSPVCGKFEEGIRVWAPVYCQEMLREMGGSSTSRDTRKEMIAHGSFQNPGR